MPWVQVKPGMTHGVNDRYGAGAVFEATAEELRDFGDKLVTVPQPEDVHAPQEAVSVDAPPVAPVSVAPDPQPKRRTRKG